MNLYLSRSTEGSVQKVLQEYRREGNKPPRIAETPSGILNSVGLQNLGVEHFAKHIMPILCGI